MGKHPTAWTDAWFAEMLSFHVASIGGRSVMSLVVVGGGVQASAQELDYSKNKLSGAFGPLSGRGQLPEGGQRLGDSFLEDQVPRKRPPVAFRGG